MLKEMRCKLKWALIKQKKLDIPSLDTYQCI